MKYNTIFWDWNGTIIDDLDISVESINSLLKARGMKPYEKYSEYYNVFRFPIEDYYKKAGFDFSVEPFDKLAKEYVKYYNSITDNAKVFSDVLKMVQKLHAKGTTQIVLSASKRDELIEWLKRVNIYQYFDDVIGLDNIYAHGKIDIALKWLNNHDINLKKAVMIGDTTHDAEVAKAMGCDCFLISRGHSSFADLQKTNCKVFDNAFDVLNFIK